MKSGLEEGEGDPSDVVSQHCTCVDVYIHVASIFQALPCANIIL